MVCVADGTTFNGVWLSLARAPGLGPGGRRFESCHPDFLPLRAGAFRNVKRLWGACSPQLFWCRIYAGAVIVLRAFILSYSCCVRCLSVFLSENRCLCAAVRLFLFCRFDERIFLGHAYDIQYEHFCVSFLFCN